MKLKLVPESFSVFEYQTSLFLKAYSQFSHMTKPVILPLFPQLTDCAPALYPEKSMNSLTQDTGSYVLEKVMLSLNCPSS